MSVVTSLFKNRTRWVDSVGRYDEWEFLPMLPETTTRVTAPLGHNVDSNWHTADA